MNKQIVVVYDKLEIVAHKIVRKIKSSIETKRKFIFILFAINELIC